MQAYIFLTAVKKFLLLFSVLNLICGSDIQAPKVDNKKKEISLAQKKEKQMTLLSELVLLNFGTRQTELPLVLVPILFW